MGGLGVELFDLSGKVAIITGSSKGIGKAIAERLAEHNAWRPDCLAVFGCFSPVIPAGAEPRAGTARGAVF